MRLSAGAVRSSLVAATVGRGGGAAVTRSARCGPDRAPPRARRAAHDRSARSSRARRSRRSACWPSATGSWRRSRSRSTSARDGLIAMPDGAEPSADDEARRPRSGRRAGLPALRRGHARDAARRSPRAVPGLATWREVQIDDPLDADAGGFAYVVVADAPARRPTRRYVAYEPARRPGRRRRRIGSAWCRRCPTYFAIAMQRPARDRTCSTGSACAPRRRCARASRRFG